jgi:hypothetical protein
MMNEGKDEDGKTKVHVLIVVGGRQWTSWI